MAFICITPLTSPGPVAPADLSLPISGQEGAAGSEGWKGPEMLTPVDTG